MSVRIFAVSEGSPAEKAGIEAEDRIISINGEAVTDEIGKRLSVKQNGNPSD